MTIEELKVAWKEYDAKLQSTRLLTEKLVISMIRERSGSRLSQLTRRHVYGLAYMCVMLLVGAAVLAGNPFDYQRPIEYIPIGIYCICMMILIFGMLKAYSELKRVEINNDNIESSLKKIISVYEKPNRFFHHAIVVLLITSTTLFPLSFLQRKIEKAGLWPGMIDTLIPIVLSVTLVFIAYRLGAFKERQAEKFRRDMDELNNLKGISEELRNV